MRYRKRRKEEYDSEAIVIDILPYVLSIRGNEHEDKRGNPRNSSVLAVGVKYYTLLDLEPKELADIKIGEIVGLAPGKRDKIKYVARKLRYDELPESAKENLLDAIIKIVKMREKEYVDFINKADMITSVLHSLMLLPGVGPKLYKKIISERKKQPFENFEDFNRRVGISGEKLIARRIIEEMKERQKYYLFLRKNLR